MSQKETINEFFSKKLLTNVTECAIMMSRKVTVIIMNLRKCRIRRGLTQKEVADALKVRSNTISQWETGQREPSITKLKLLAMLYECSLDDLLSEEATK